MASCDHTCETKSCVSIVPVIFQAGRNNDLQIVTCICSWHSFSILLKKKKKLNGFPQLIIGEIIKVTITAEGMDYSESWAK